MYRVAYLKVVPINAKNAKLLGIDKGIFIKTAPLTWTQTPVSAVGDMSKYAHVLQNMFTVRTDCTGMCCF
jgi:hypothetical protein